MQLKPILMQARRECWEHRTLFLVPSLIVALLSSILWCSVMMHNPLFQMNLNEVPEHVKAFALEAPDGNGARINFDKQGVLSFIISIQQFAAWWVYAVVATALALRYCGSSLFSDRKSREILFWRSMPVSETVNVIVKLFVALVSIPLIILFMHLISIVIGLLVLGIWVGDWGQFWSALSAVPHTFKYLSGSVVVALMVMPLLTWTMLSSSYAKRSPQLLAVFVPVGLLMLDKVLQKFTDINLYIDDTLSHYAEYLYEVLSASLNHSGNNDVIFTTGFGLNMDYLPIAVLVILMLLATIWLRNHRYEI